MVHIEFDCSYEKANLLLKVAELYDEGKVAEVVRKGQWYKYESSYRCSECDFIEAFWHRYCPNCGVKME